MAEFSDYAWLVSGAAAADYLVRLADDPRPALQQLEALRRELPIERARLLVEQAELRRRAAVKFGDAATRMFFAPTLLEQATDAGIARYKASRFTAAAPGRRINDYCCGLGGDLMALAAVAPCVGWDRSETACLLANANLQATGGSANGSEARCADVATLTPAPDEPWHVDPDRRASGTRSTQMSLQSPGPETIERWLSSSTDGAVKLAPATDPPTSWQQTAELEWITSQRECRQLVAWFGKLATAPGQRRATRIDSAAGESVSLAAATFVGEVDRPCDAASAPGRYVFDLDPSVIAARLLGAFARCNNLRSLGAGSVYLTGDRPLSDSLMQTFQVEECLPLRAPLVASYLAERNVGRVEVKKRGVATDPERFRRELKLRGDHAASVILTRIGKREVAIVATRLTDAGTALNERVGSS